MQRHEPPKNISNVWTSMKTPPTQTGQYRVRFDDGREGVAFWTRTLGGKCDWLTFGDRVITEYQLMINNVTK